MSTSCDPERFRWIVDEALALGINLIDSADLYAGGEAERCLGEALKGRRHGVLVATKTGWPVGDRWDQRGLSRRRLVLQLETSLKHLQTDYVDLFYFHRPDPETPLEESVVAIGDMIRAGKALYFGLCNYPAWQVAEAVAICRRLGIPSPVALQSEYNLLNRSVEREVLDACAHLGVGFLPHTPLAGGFLTGKYTPGSPPPPGSRAARGERRVTRLIASDQSEVVARYEAAARAFGHSLTELALAWLLAQPSVASAIVGATSSEQLRANAAAAAWKLSAEELASVEAIR